MLISTAGVITYTTNQDTSTVIRQMVSSAPALTTPLRILLETDAPYMVPANLYDSIIQNDAKKDNDNDEKDKASGIKGKKLPVCHSAMVPWTAEFVATVAGDGWAADRVMREARENARMVYGV